MPRLRMLRVIQARFPHKFKVCRGYVLTYYTELLSCGHTKTVYPQADPLTAKRRNCSVCVVDEKRKAG